MKSFLTLTIYLFLTFRFGFSQNYDAAEQKFETDVLVYGATPSGIMVALAVKTAGYDVIIVEPSRWVGGILGAGLKPLQDMPNYDAIGGTTRNLLVILGSDSLKDYEIKELAKDPHGKYRALMGKQSPKDIQNDFLTLLKESKVEIIYNHRISYIIKQELKIKEAFFDLAPFDEYGCPVGEADIYGNMRIKSKIFVDASYDGELMARSGVSNQIGRESKLDYNEEFAGVRPLDNITPINPFIDPDNPESGLLPMLENDHGKPLGAGDHYSQAYNFRYYVTSDPQRRVAIKPPENYDPIDYELVGRYLSYLVKEFKNPEELLKRLNWIFPGGISAEVHNYQRTTLISMAPLGISHLYAAGDYATKARVWKAHQVYLRGLHHFLSTDERVPDFFRDKTANLGLDKLHHPDTNGWPHQLYIRVSRRMIGEYTITAHDVYNRTEVKDPIGLAQYGIDTYPSRRIWFKRNDSIFVANEGNMFVGGSYGPTNVPYSIPYRSITPQKHECTNLLVPVLFSSTHLGYASARMEPTFMIVGESAGIAAIHALEENMPVQDINMERYLTKLKELGQHLYWEQISK